MSLNHKDELTDAALIKRVKDVIRLEAETVLAQVGRVNHRFAEAVRLLVRCNGRVVVLGVGAEAAVS